MLLSILFGKFRNKVREGALDRAIAKLPRANQPWVTAGEAAKAIGYTDQNGTFHYYGEDE